MARYCKEISLGIPREKVEEILQDFLQKNDFYTTVWKGESCYTADVSIVREVRFLNYTYDEEGVLHFEAWLRDGTSKEQGLTGFAAMDLKKPYLDEIISLLDRCVEASPQARENRDIILRPEEKQFSIYKILLPLAMLLAFALIWASRSL